MSPRPSALVRAADEINGGSSCNAHKSLAKRRRRRSNWPRKRRESAVISSLSGALSSSPSSPSRTLCPLSTSARQLFSPSFLVRVPSSFTLEARLGTCPRRQLRADYMPSQTPADLSSWRANRLFSRPIEDKQSTGSGCMNERLISSIV